MPQITKLSLQKNKQVVNIFIDDRFTASLDLVSVKKLGLKTGIDISGYDLMEIIKKSAYEKLTSFAFRFLSYRPRSQREVHSYLMRKIKAGKIKNVEEKTVNKLINKLNKKNLIDDYKFANWWIEQRQKFRPKGKFILKKELLMKGVDKEIIDELLISVDDVSAAQKVLKKKLKTISKEKDKKRAKQKLIGFLARRGFTWPTIKTVVDEIMPKK